jgi:hypothetical protein
MKNIFIPMIETNHLNKNSYLNKNHFVKQTVLFIIFIAKIIKYTNSTANKEKHSITSPLILILFIIHMQLLSNLQ